jgi:hypothetical protein
MNFLGSSDADLASSAAQPTAQPIATKPASQPVHRALICRQATLLRRKLPSKKNRAADITSAVPELTAPDRGVWAWGHKAYSLRRVNGGGIEKAKVVLEEAAKLFPGDSVIQYNLACYCAQLGQLDAPRRLRLWPNKAKSLQQESPICFVYC